MTGLGSEAVAVGAARPPAAAEPPGGSGRGHVLVVVENIPLCADHRVRKQVDALLGAGYRVSVITRRDPGNEPYRRTPGLRVLEHPSQPEPTRAAGYLLEYGAAFLWAGLLSAAARRRGPVDVVQFCQPPDIYFPLARLLHRAGAAVVVDQRDLMPELFVARYGARGSRMLGPLRWLERRTQRAAGYAIGVNDYLRERIVRAGARPECVAVVRNGPVLARVRTAEADPTLRGGFPFHCCWVGKMGRQDRVDLLVEAIAELVHRRGRQDIRFTLIGDGECLPELREQVTLRGLERWVAFPGWLSERAVFAHLAAADLGLDTSLQVEVSPVKAMEYLAFGLPVVAFGLPETAELVRGAGVLVAPGEVSAFAAEVAALLDDPERRGRLGKAGRRRVAEELCWERQAGTYLALIDRAARQSAWRRGEPSRASG